MDTVLKLSAIGSLLLILIGLGTIIYRIGKTEQKLTGKIESLEDGRTENRKQVDRALSELTAHEANELVHVNAKLEERTYLELKEWRRKVDERLDVLVKGAR